MADRIVPLKDTAQKTHKTRHLTLHGTFHRHRGHHKHRQHVVRPCCSVRHPCTKNLDHFNLKMGQEVQKTLKTITLAHYFSDDRAADGRKHSANMREIEILKICIFEMRTFLQVKSTFSNDDVSNNMHSWSIHWVFHMIFCKLTL